jgi:hypothetical protein
MVTWDSGAHPWVYFVRHNVRAAGVLGLLGRVRCSGWGFPGGLRRRNESPEAAISRKIARRFAIDLPPHEWQRLGEPFTFLGGDGHRGVLDCLLAVTWNDSGLRPDPAVYWDDEWVLLKAEPSSRELEFVERSANPGRSREILRRTRVALGR